MKQSASITSSPPNREPACVFCGLPEGREIEAENDLAVLIRDGFPVTELHSLVIPKRHVANYFELSPAEVDACHRLLIEAKARIEEIDPNVTGFNIGINAGASAGQTVFHCHIHLIPRRDGDTPNPRGGVRNIIAGRGGY